MRTNLVLAGAAAVALTVLFVLRRPPDSEKHDRMMPTLQVMERLDTEINADLLSSRCGLIKSYDPFVRKLEETRQAEDGLQLIPALMNRHNRERMVRLLAQESEVLSESASH